jgi:hypothetical protein
MDKNIRFINLSLKFINITLEKKLFGAIMAFLGISCLLLAAYHFVQGSAGTNHPVLSFAMYCILGLLFFFAGIGMIRNSRDLTTRS